MELPLSAELYSVAQLEEHAGTLASRHRLTHRRPRARDGLLSRLHDNAASLREAHRYLMEIAATETRLTPAGEWFIDNYHVIEEQIRLAKRHLPRSYSRQLPHLATPLVAGTPRVYDIVLELIAHSEGRVDVDGLRAFVAAYQKSTSLRLGELWAIPIMLRLALIENLRRVVAAVTAGRRDRQLARNWANRMIEAAADKSDRAVTTLAKLIEMDPPLTISFVAELATRLREKGTALMFPLSWLEQRLAEGGQTLEQIFQVISQSQADHQVAIGNIIGSMRLVGATDWPSFVESLSVVEATLRTDPSGTYPTMDFATRDRYRRAVEWLSRRSRTAEESVAAAAISLAHEAARAANTTDPDTSPRGCHVGYFLIDDGRRHLEQAVGARRSLFARLREAERRVPFAAYGAALTVFTAVMTVALARTPIVRHLPPWPFVLTVAAFAIASSQLAIELLHWAAILWALPRTLPRLDFSKGIPPQHRAAVVVPTLLTDDAEIDSLVEGLEVRFLANRDPNLAFVLLTDFRDAPQEHMPRDEALLARAAAGIRALNRRYGEIDAGPFFLLHRPRRFNARDRIWMGWERKRGKLEELNGALRGLLSPFHTTVGDVARLGDVKYVIVLDSDTELPRDAARELVGTLAHWLNRPIYDEGRGRVVRGYAILQPRVAVTMTSVTRSRFAQLFSGESGIDPYTRAVSDVYQDLFGEGSFVGKGIYDVNAFSRSLAGRLPDNRILSHDLLEGAHARSGLVSDVTLFEDQPSTYAADVSRRHRWMRGDWQIVPWLGPLVPSRAGGRLRNPISALSRWKILDNLRRSLVPIAMTALLFGAAWIPNAWPFAALVIFAILLAPGLLAALTALVRAPADLPYLRHAREVGLTFVRQTLRQLFWFSCLPYEAYLSVDAVVTTTLRILVTKRRLLEWRTAREAQRQRASLAGTYATMWAAPVTALAMLSALPASGRPLPWSWSVLAVAWALVPAVAWWVSQPLVRRRAELGAADRRFLRMLARRTWRFFEVFVNAADNHLPPDNFQEDPPRGVAHRTSPTNMGLALAANLAAYDFGYLSAGDVMERTSLTLSTMERLPRFRGHFFNWYDTSTLAPLPPAYVSTVDSGNLAGHLLVVASGLDEMIGAAAFSTRIFDGLVDALDVLSDAESAARPKRAAARLAEIRQRLAAPPAALSDCRRLLEATAEDFKVLESASGGEVSGDSEAAAWSSVFSDQCRRALAELVWIAPWLDAGPGRPRDERTDALWSTLDRGPTLTETALLEMTHRAGIEEAIGKAGGAPETVAWLNQFAAATALASTRATGRIDELRRLSTRCRQLADVEYEFLYDRSRHLLSIGYNVADQRLDASFYDLLASEARLSSFVAISEGKLPQEHWFHLGRQLTTNAASNRPVLLSWSGSMFEYLMPLLVMPTYEGTILDETYRGVVERQEEYGVERRVPWGVSESGYNKTDAQLNYQYRAFGVPGLGFKRGLRDDLVIAPYAGVMGLMVDPVAACANLRRMTEAGFAGAFGFYEAVDYTPARLPPGKASVTIRSFMSHHQGMSFLSLDYLLADRPMQRRFEAMPAIQAMLLLLQERVPRVEPIEPHAAERGALGAPAETASSLRSFTSPNTASPEVHLLSNGRYHVGITNAGGGYSRWRDLAITRWREDPTRDHWGQYCYVRDVESDEFWSTTHQPSLKPASSYEAVFTQGRAEFRRRDGDIQCYTEISVSPEDDVEVRRTSVTNRSARRRTIEVTTFAELVLAPPAADAAHPVFSNLFVETEIVQPRQAILGTRRARSAQEKPPWALHLMTVHNGRAGTLSYETDRSAFVGRGRSPVDPAALHEDALTNSAGAVLDPALAIRTRVEIAPGETVRFHVVTGVAETRAGALALVEKYGDPHSSDRVFDLSWTHAQVVLRQLGASEADAQLYERMAGHILYSSPAARASSAVIARNRRGQSALWAYGISGDLPIVLLRIAEQSNLQLAQQLVKAHAYWRVKGLAVDLVIWNEDSSVYRQALQDEIMATIGSSAEGVVVDRPGGVFIRRADQLSEDDKVLLQTVARLIVSDAEGPLAEQMERRPRKELPGPLSVTKTRRMPSASPVPPPGAGPAGSAPSPTRALVADNGLGGFSADGREYVITTTRARRTPAPWVNVLANPWFGSVVSESGGAYTWCENASTYRLTPWHNDPVSDPSGEAIYLRDEDDGMAWSPTPLPLSGEAPYVTRHGFGYSAFEHTEGGIESELVTYVARDAPIKFVVIKVRNASGRLRRLSLTAVCELVLGTSAKDNAPYVVTEVEPTTGAVLARNAYNAEFAARVAFLDCSEASRSISGDRAEILGRNGTYAAPAFLSRSRLSGRTGAGFDPCLAVQTSFDLAAHQEREVVFTLGSGRDTSDARTLLHRFRGAAAARSARAEVAAYWERALGAVTIETPEPAVNFLANGWLLYQTLSARIWGRSGFYQSGGAFGFRDQLQDAMALVFAEPALLREQILRSAARQFQEGDVQHWWHPPTGRGVRTRISDDYLWLPYAVCRYVSALGDTGVLGEIVPFLEGRAVKADEEGYYDLPARSEETGTLYEHCVRAIRNGLRFGAHGLPLMGSGDWNDGMNLVGHEGKGESVWLAFFLHDVLTKFATIAQLREDHAFAALCTGEAGRLAETIDRHAWDGAWYRRAYFDDGRALGTAQGTACQIDALPQSWAALTGVGQPDRIAEALQAVDQRLVRRDLGLVQLFDPPFDRSDGTTGYVEGYLPGVRENGGQYTHAAVWTAMAYAARGDAARAWELLELMSPVAHGDSAQKIAVYKVEPYVVAADLYTNPSHPGRGGWTWYTGSAAWMYRLIIESLLGLRLDVDRLHINPLLPEGWGRIAIRYRYHQTTYAIAVRQVAASDNRRIVCDGTKISGPIVLLNDGVVHVVEVEIPSPGTKMSGLRMSL